jgi:hypothetical protein
MNGMTLAILIFLGCGLAFITRDLNPKFGEAKQLGEFCNTGYRVVVV